MIEQNTRVTTLDAQSIGLQTTAQSAGCQHCHVNGACGTSLLAQLLPKRLSHQLQLPIQAMPGAVKVGDQVLLGISEHYLYQAMLWLYALPLAGLVGGAVLGALAGNYFPGITAVEPASIIAGLLGLSAGIGYARYHSWRPGKALEQHIQVLEIVPAELLSVKVT